METKISLLNNTYAFWNITLRTRNTTTHKLIKKKRWTLSLSTRIVCTSFKFLGVTWGKSTTYKILSNILLSRLIPYAEEVIGDHQCGFRRNRSTTDHIFCIWQILEKKWEYNEAVHQLFIDFKKAYDSVRREVLYNILIELGSQRNW